MTDEIIDRPITYVVKVSRTTTVTALIPVIAMTPEEAKQKAWAERFANYHEWKTSGNEETMHGVVETRGFANEFQTKNYVKENQK